MNSREDDQPDWALGAIKERGLALEGYCVTNGCGRFYIFDVDKLIAMKGADYVVPDMGVVCTKCGSDLQFKLAFVPPGMSGEGSWPSST